MGVFRAACFGFGAAIATAAQAAVITVPDGDVVADHEVINGLSWGGAVGATTIPFDAQSGPVTVTGSLTSISTSLITGPFNYVQFSLVDANSWDNTEGAWNEGVYLIVYPTTYPENNVDGTLGIHFKSPDDSSGPFLEGLAYPTVNEPISFSFTLTPNGSAGGTATATFPATLSGSSLSWAYSADLSEALLVVQFLSYLPDGPGATASFVGVSATTVPEPAGLAGLAAAGLALLARRRSA